MSHLLSLQKEQNYYLIQMDDGKANALSLAMFEQLNAAFDQAIADEKVLVLTGRAGRFSGGFDLVTMKQGGQAMQQLLAEGAKFAHRLVASPVPTVIAASGHSLAMGALLLLSSDYRIGIQGDFKIGLNEVEIGMPLPYFGVELARSRMDNKHIVIAVELAGLCDGNRAVDVGYLDEVVSPEALLARADQVAARLSRLDMQAYRLTKSRTRAGLADSLVAALDRDLAFLRSLEPS